MEYDSDHDPGKDLEADTIDPGTTPLKWKLGYGEASKTDYCQ